MSTVSRRDFVQTSLGAAALGSSSALFAQTPATGAISIALASRSPTTVNPFQPGRTGGDNWAIFQIFDALVASPNGTFAIRPEDFKPQLAESFTSSPDARTWTYKLRRGVQFHKGFGEMTADDVVFTFTRNLDPKIVTYLKQVFSNIDTVKALDKYTVQMVPSTGGSGSCVTVDAAVQRVRTRRPDEHVRAMGPARRD